MQSRYEQRGVSADKSEVHKAIANIDKGLFKNAFCKILPDTLALSNQHCIVMHTDTAGTKPALAYLYYKETKDRSVWKDIAQDALVMNLDDMACVGITDQITISSNIARNKKCINAENLKDLIQGTQKLIEEFKSLGVHINHSGGETADVGDVVKTLDVGFTAIARIKKEDLIVNNIKPDQVIVGFASYGKSSYENTYNSGIGSNGLTSARHDLLAHEYAEKYPETYDEKIDSSLTYSGSFKVDQLDQTTGVNIGKLLLSPTRSFTPLLHDIFKQIDRKKLSGIIHNTGGGQTKVLKFIENIEVIKDNLIEVAPIFNLIEKETQTPMKEMFQTFNMGTRLEIYTDQITAEKLILIADKFNIQAQIIGFTKASSENKVTIKHNGQTVTYS